MNTSAANKSNSSAATSAKRPTPANKSTYLTQQADDAQAAIKRALEDMKASLAQGVDIRAWAREHPWGMAALATATGFALASAAIPSKHQQELKRWIAMERAAAAAASNGKASSPAEPQPGFLGALGKEVLAIVRPAIVAMVSSAVASYQDNAAPPDEEPDGSVP